MKCALNWRHEKPLFPFIRAANRTIRHTGASRLVDSMPTGGGKHGAGHLLKTAMIIGLDMLMRAAYCRGVLRALLFAFSKREGVEPIILEKESGRYNSLERVDGIIGFFAEEDRTFLTNPPVPVVNISSRMYDCPVPVVTDDNVGIGRMAADYLLELGCEDFGFCGRHEHLFAVLREEGFRQRLAESKRFAAGRYHFFDIPESKVHTDLPELFSWLSTISKPTGVFCVNDELALRISHLARAAGVSVPHPLSLLGADDDDISVLADGNLLSSIRQDFDRIAGKALDLIISQIQGGPPPSPVTVVPPLQLITRQSTDMTSNVDPRMLRAIRFIRENACGGIGVQDVLANLPMSRRVFETRFKEAFGHSPYEEILKVRMDRAKRILAESPDRTVPQVAERCGYENSKQFSAMFKKMVGMSPSDFRASRG